MIQLPVVANKLQVGYIIQGESKLLALSEYFFEHVVFKLYNKKNNRVYVLVYAMKIAIQCSLLFWFIQVYITYLKNENIQVRAREIIQGQQP